MGGTNAILTVFLISCGSDGSVHRNVRKLVKKIKEEGSQEEIDPPPRWDYGIALLGHSICKTSAEQTKEQVFGAGCRLAKILKQVYGPPLVDTLETQVELVGPEESF